MPDGLHGIGCATHFSLARQAYACLAGYTGLTKNGATINDCPRLQNTRTDLRHFWHN